MRGTIVAIVAFLAACTGRGGFDPSRDAREAPSGELPIDDDDEPVATDEDDPLPEEPSEPPHIIDLGPAARDRNGSMPRISLGPDGNLAFAYRAENGTRIEWWHDGAWENLGATVIGVARDIDVAYRAPNAFYVATESSSTTLHQRTNTTWSLVNVPAYARTTSPDSWEIRAAAVRMTLAGDGTLLMHRCVDEGVVGPQTGPYRQRAFLETLGINGMAPSLWNVGQFYYVGDEQADYIRHARLALDATVGGAAVGGRIVLDQLWLARFSAASQSTLEHSLEGGTALTSLAMTAMPDTTLVLAYTTASSFILERSPPVSENDGVPLGGWTGLPTPSSSSTPTEIALGHAGDTLVMAYTAGAILNAVQYDGATWVPFEALGDSRVSGSNEDPASDPQLSAQKGEVCLAWRQTSARMLRTLCFTL